MRVQHERGKCIINLFLDFVFYNCEYVKSGQDGVCEVDVVIEISVALVNTSERVCCGNH